MKPVLLLVAMGVTPIFAGDDSKTAAEQLRGRWEVVKSEGDGGEVKGIIVEGNSWTVVLRNFEGKEDLAKCEFTVDAATKPARIDISYGASGRKQKNLGIYELTGDVLKLCTAADGKERPTRFQAGEGRTLTTLKRAKK